MSKRLSQPLCALILVTLLSGCDLFPGGPTPEPPAAGLLPQLPGYATIEGQTLTAYIGKLSGGAALLAGQPELAATLTVVDAVIGCYQQVGAVRARVYSQETAPLIAGVVAIADRNVLTDPVNLFRCVAPNVLSQPKVQFQPCKATYTLKRQDDEFYILYAGTTLEICQAFCSRLEGCTAHKP